MDSAKNIYNEKIQIVKKIYIFKEYIVERKE